MNLTIPESREFTQDEKAKHYAAELAEGRVIIEFHKGSYYTVPASELMAFICKLQDFKRYVHTRLDAMGVPNHPTPEAHEGCRIGSRLDWIVNDIAYWKSEASTRAAQ